MDAVIPYLLYADPDAAVEFLTRAFGFSERNRTVADDGRILNVELVGPSGGQVWLGQSEPQGTSMVYVYVDDVDAHFERARAEGARIENVPKDVDYGDRRYDAKDPEGHWWFFAHPIADESPARRG